ncbi:putative per-hexamer repeat protein 5 isoform X2 [Arabidopsis lyrata subsp. lyrata]|uniref:putative per-hexamer repeat protein 5 isoform X2 n=1 Tax=Arabidopsis lyrata subsp. lyrata TaxID=81972 RepID=UPI000A29CA6F|nr:putative per-hexamer repeat protein 5 isoform X2 [Arabidopsis lyrata subsp. lyrata]|eukprot:XP_020879712.1 putative per-hexamer repeat protein 5 isoform X2 [Arabidopsis lyrata subsp. lyrata]
MAKISLALGLLLLVALSEVYEVQGTFLFRHYLRKFPRRSRDFRPFACKGMLKFVDVLEVRCPLKPQYKSFFGNLRSYMNFINSASGSKNFDAELKGKAQGLLSAMSAMSGKGGASADSSKVMDTLLSMGKTLGNQQQSGSTVMSFGQRKEMIMSMVKWAQTIGQFVASAAAKSGNKIDISSLGIDGIDANAAAGAGDSTATGTGSSGATTGGSTTAGSDTAAGGTTAAGAGTAAGGYTATGSGTAAGTGTTTGAGTAAGSGTAAGGYTTTNSGTAAGAGTAAGGTTAAGPGTAAGGTTAAGAGTAAGGTTAAGSVSGSYGSSGGSASNTNVGTNSCTTNACSNGGGASFKGAMNFQGKASSRSQEAASTQTSDGSS